MHQRIPSSVTSASGIRSFRGSNGDGEHFIILVAPAELSFEGQISFLHEKHRESLESLQLKPETAVFKRIFASDLINQTQVLQKSLLFGSPEEGPVAVSLVQQPPLPCSRLALLAYHIDGEVPLKKKRITPSHTLVERNAKRHLWSTRLCCKSNALISSEEVQTREIFEQLVDALRVRGGTLRDNCVRTWLFVKDMDVSYNQIVKTRREFFTREGLTDNTHYIASTGIKGGCEHGCDLVSMDAYSLLDVTPAQVSYLNDFDYMCSPKDYHVTFERATQVAYADRAHIFLSGTASIDRKGRSLHSGSALKQLEQTLLNIGALLKAGSASVADLMYMIVYLRDRADYDSVSGHLKKLYPDIPMVFVEGALCRPEWLVEIEGFAIRPNDAPSMPSF